MIVLDRGPLILPSTPTKATSPLPIVRPPVTSKASASEEVTVTLAGNRAAANVPAEILEALIAEMFPPPIVGDATSPTVMVPDPLVISVSFAVAVSVARAGSVLPSPISS